MVLSKRGYRKELHYPSDDARETRKTLDLRPSTLGEQAINDVLTDSARI